MRSARAPASAPARTRGTLGLIIALGVRVGRAGADLVRVTSRWRGLSSENLKPTGAARRGSASRPGRSWRKSCPTEAGSCVTVTGDHSQSPHWQAAHQPVAQCISFKESTHKQEARQLRDRAAPQLPSPARHLRSKKIRYFFKK